jgi:Protein of unknown function (DUF2971)
VSTKIYKYVGCSYLDKVIGLSGQVTLKCSYPKDFNDPYELFLTIDFNQQPDVLAFYSDVIGQIPQLPTTCFSRSPIVVPMWAHYAQNSEGFVLEFDEATLAKSFPESGFGDVEYQDAAGDDLTDVLSRAFEIGKPRYLYMLQRGVFNAAYYTKMACWSYELERRMIVRQSETRSNRGMILMDVPKRCVTALICGSRATPKTAKALRGKARQLGCKYYDLRIGKTSPLPYFVDLAGSPSTFTGIEIKSNVRCCESCNEPLEVEAGQCSWCQIEESHKYEAAQRNVFRALANAGLLKNYIKEMNAVTDGDRKK